MIKGQVTLRSNFYKNILEYYGANTVCTEATGVVCWSCIQTCGNALVDSLFSTGHKVQRF